MVPAEAAGPRVEETIARRAKGDGPSGVAEVTGFAPPVHRGPFRSSRGGRDNGGGTRAVARRRHTTLRRDLSGQGSVALRSTEDHSLVASGGKEQAEAGCRRPAGH